MEVLSESAVIAAAGSVGGCERFSPYSFCFPTPFCYYVGGQWWFISTRSETHDDGRSTRGGNEVLKHASLLLPTKYAHACSLVRMIDDDNLPYEALGENPAGGLWVVLVSQCAYTREQSQ